jgi:flagellar hook-length control protein FliK
MTITKQQTALAPPNLAGVSIVGKPNAILASGNGFLQLMDQLAVPTTPEAPTQLAAFGLKQSVHAAPPPLAEVDPEAASLLAAELSFQLSKPADVTSSLSEKDLGLLSDTGAPVSETSSSELSPAQIFAHPIAAPSNVPEQIPIPAVAAPISGGIAAQTSDKRPATGLPAARSVETNPMLFTAQKAKVERPSEISEPRQQRLAHVPDLGDTTLVGVQTTQGTTENKTEPGSAQVTKPDPSILSAALPPIPAVAVAAPSPLPPGAHQDAPNDIPADQSVLNHRENNPLSTQTVTKQNPLTDDGLQIALSKLSELQATISVQPNGKAVLASDEATKPQHQAVLGNSSVQTLPAARGEPATPLAAVTPRLDRLTTRSTNEAQAFAALPPSGPPAPAPSTSAPLYAAPLAPVPQVAMTSVLAVDAMDFRLIDPEQGAVAPINWSGTETSRWAAPEGKAFGQPSHPVPPAAVGRVLVEMAQTGQADAIEIALSPHELGRVRLHMVPDGDAIRVTIMVERPETMDLLRRNTESFLNDLRQAGFAGASFSFSQWSDGPPVPRPALQTDHDAPETLAVPIQSDAKNNMSKLPPGSGLYMRL